MEENELPFMPEHMGKGSSGPAVAALQAFIYVFLPMEQRGEYGSMRITGEYDQDTEDMVRCLQRNLGFPETEQSGTFDVKTQNRILGTFGGRYFEAFNTPFFKGTTHCTKNGETLPWPPQTGSGPE